MPAWNLDIESLQWALYLLMALLVALLILIVAVAVDDFRNWKRRE